MPLVFEGAEFLLRLLKGIHGRPVLLGVALGGEPSEFATQLGNVVREAQLLQSAYERGAQTVQLLLIARGKRVGGKVADERAQGITRNFHDRFDKRAHGDVLVRRFLEEAGRAHTL